MAGGKKTFRRVPIRALLPNLVTLLAICSGLTAVRMALEARFEIAVGAIVLAAILDAVDGRLARMLKATSRFGAELDSLADFVNFGVVPALVIYIWMTANLGAIGWLGALVFAIACALRLARFNVATDDPAKPTWSVDFFVGVPAPAGALIALLPMYLSFIFGVSSAAMALPVMLHLVATGILMGSRIPTFSAKRTIGAVPREMVVPVLAGAALFLALLATYPFSVLAAGTLTYLALIPVAFLRHRALSRQHEAANGRPLPASANDDLPSEEDDTPRRKDRRR